MLALFVCALVMVDVVILFVYTLVEGVSGNLGPVRVIHAENPSDILGVRTTVCIRFIVDTNVQPTI